LCGVSIENEFRLPIPQNWDKKPKNWRERNKKYYKYH
jgi:hypothetical protein